MMGSPAMPEAAWLDIPSLLGKLDSAGINNAAVARKLNVYRSSVYRWKQGGEIKLVHWRQLIKIVEALPDRKPPENAITL